MNITFEPGKRRRFGLTHTDADMKTFASLLSVGIVDKPVVDMTGLSGNFDIAIELSQEDALNAFRSNITFLGPANGGGDGRGGDGKGGACGCCGSG